MTQQQMDTRATSGRPLRPGIAVLVAGGCAVVVTFQVALTLGAPFGAAALGGANTGQLPNELRMVTGRQPFSGLSRHCSLSAEEGTGPRRFPGRLRGGGPGSSRACWGRGRR